MTNDPFKILKLLNILYLEDEENIRNNISKILRFMCREVYEVSNAKDGIAVFNNNKIDIIISDITMPEISGIDFVKIIRNKKNNIPILLLTAHTDTNYLLEATKLKLVDYLVKPLNLKDLKKALSNAAVEYERENGITINFDNNIEYNINKKQLFENKIKKNITNKEILLLEFLYKYRDRVVSIDEIKNYLWEDSYSASDTALKSVLNKLRNKIGKNSIKNISGLGYQIEIN
jgi:DNA-binding response OmpR family regulator